MVPRFTDACTTLYAGDNRAILPTLAPHDVCITDPPYATTTHQGARTAPEVAGFRSARQTHRVGGETPNPLTFAPFGEYDLYRALRLIAEVTRFWIVLTCDWNHIHAIKTWCESGEFVLGTTLAFIRHGILVKATGTYAPPNSAPQYTGDRPASGWEALAILHRRGTGRMRWNGGGKHAVYYAPINASARITPNPTAKNPRFIRQLLTDFVQDGQTVLDPFCGSGVVLVEARKMGIVATGIEQNPADTEPLAAYLQAQTHQQHRF